MRPATISEVPSVSSTPTTVSRAKQLEEDTDSGVDSDSEDESLASTAVTGRQAYIGATVGSHVVRCTNCTEEFAVQVNVAFSAHRLRT